MASDNDKPTPRPIISQQTREIIRIGGLVVGFYLIVSGLNGALGWGLSSTATTVIGVAIGLGVALAARSWLRKS